MTLNRPFPSFKNSHFQNEAKYENFVVKMSLICHFNGFALSLALNQRLEVTGKWPIEHFKATGKSHVVD